jgi:hypothetical protein
VMAWGRVSREWGWQLRGGQLVDKRAALGSGLDLMSLEAR